MTDTPETKAPKPADKPKRATDIACPACGSVIGQLCRRRPRALNYLVSQETPCYARTRLFMRAHGLGRKYRKGGPRFRQHIPPSD